MIDIRDESIPSTISSNSLNFAKSSSFTYSLSTSSSSNLGYEKIKSSLCLFNSFTLANISFLIPSYSYRFDMILLFSSSRNYFYSLTSSFCWSTFYISRSRTALSSCVASRTASMDSFKSFCLFLYQLTFVFNISLSISRH